MTPDYNFVFFDNFISLFQDARFYDALWNTVVFTLGTLIPTIVLGLMLALLMQKAFKGSGIIKFILFSPWITPTVAVSIVWTWIYDPNTGIANTVMRFLHLPELQWIKSSDTAMLAVIIVTVWKSLGYAMIFYLSALEKVPKELYEASGLDGAKRWQRFRDVTIPCISPTTFFLVIITMVTSLQAYDQIQILTQGGPSGSTRTLLYMYYQLGFEEFNMGQATAVAIVMIIITVVLSAVQFGASKKMGALLERRTDYEDRTGIEKLGKGMILLIFSIFTIFPFVWMILSALKTKAEIMDVRSFFRQNSSGITFTRSFFESPLLRYVGNSLFVSVITLALQIVTGAMIAYAIVFMNFKGKKALFAVIMGTYMLPTAATYIPS